MESTRSESRKAHMVGVVVVKWLIVVHQHHPSTHHQVLPKTTPLITLVLTFQPMQSPTERRERVVVSE